LIEQLLYGGRKNEACDGSEWRGRGEDGSEPTEPESMIWRPRRRLRPPVSALIVST
jgi:hypothetical protein